MLATQIQIDRSGRGRGEGDQERETHNFTAHLSGGEEVPPTNTQGQGEAIFRLSDDGNTLIFRLNVANTENISMAHIHLATRGQNGPIAVWLYPSAPPAVLIPGRFDGVLSTGNITATNLIGTLQGQPLSALIERIRSGEAYVNVHTTTFPGGEIRGQIGTGSGERAEAQEDQKFTGQIESMGTGFWVIGGKTFIIDNSTVLDSGLAIGVNVKVEFMTQADGSLLAREIETAK
ncbi:MAG: CHRD domain-containing protein [Chloroflexi bacterium]|nr:CHRD domain-containing protein [Chloroflexota bacterium]